LQPPAELTGTTQSVVAHPLSQVCSTWRVLSTGIDCTRLDARLVWEPHESNPAIRTSLIEVLGTPDLKIAQSGLVRSTYTIFETVSVRGHRARVFGNSLGVHMVWQERPDLQVYLGAAATGPHPKVPTTVRDFVTEVARGMEPVAVDAGATSYRLTGSFQRFGGLIVEGQWDATFAPGGHRYCVTTSTEQCISVIAHDTNVRPRSSVLSSDCRLPSRGDDALAWGTAPARARAVRIMAPGMSAPATVATIAPPGTSGIEVYVLGLRHPQGVTITALDAHDRVIATAVAPRFDYACP
jgi:hypothetical protein